MMSYIYAYGSGFISGLLCALIIALWRYIVWRRREDSVASKDREWAETTEILKDADISREEAIAVCMSSMRSTLAEFSENIYGILERELGAEQASAVSTAIEKELAVVDQDMKKTYEQGDV